MEIEPERPQRVSRYWARSVGRLVTLPPIVIAMSEVAYNLPFPANYIVGGLGAITLSQLAAEGGDRLASTILDRPNRNAAPEQSPPNQQ